MSGSPEPPHGHGPLAHHRRALGNLLDRPRQGAMTDFLDFSIGSYHWPAFNLADDRLPGFCAWRVFWHMAKRRFKMAELSHSYKRIALMPRVP
ncbi:MAG TPA: hypothetical protein DF282_06025 [Hyphomonas sp.]|nr:hypothetical protein [Hyphomonas sp.]